MISGNDVIDVKDLTNLMEGYIINCKKINVRKKATKESEIVEVLDVNSKVLINLEKSSNEYYNVTTASGKEGYCLKEYVSI